MKVGDGYKGPALVPPKLHLMVAALALDFPKLNRGQDESSVHVQGSLVR